MYCSNCGLKHSPSARFCTNCGFKFVHPGRSADVSHVPAHYNTRPTPHHESLSHEAVISARTQVKQYTVFAECLKYFLLSSITFGAYSAYWGWRRWAFVGKMNDENPAPTLSGLFLGFTSFSLFGNLRTLSHERGYDKNFSPGLWGTLLLILFFIGNALAKAPDINFVGLLICIVILALLESLVVVSPTAALVYMLNTDEEARETYEGIGQNVILIIVLVAVILAVAAIGAASSNSSST